MAFKLRTGKTKTMYLPVTTSTVLLKDSLVAFSSGLLIAATSSTAAVDHVGVVLKAIAAADSDYATARTIAVQVPVERYTEWEADITTTAVATDIGAEVDLTDSATVNRGASSIKVARMTKFISATKGIFVIKFWGSY